jgi:hypothetical protein
MQQLLLLQEPPRLSLSVSLEEKTGLKIAGISFTLLTWCHIGISFKGTHA